MVTADSGDDRTPTSREERLAIVEEHVARENDHDLDGIMATFGEHPWFDDEPWADHHDGRGSVQGHYEDLLGAFPDLHIDVRRRHVTDDHVILETVITGTHDGPIRGLPATGRRVSFPLCAVYSFDDAGRLAGERTYYDRGTVLRQLGVFREPDRGLGRVLVPLTHPVTIARALVRTLRRP